MSVDPATLQVLIARLTGVAEGMGAVLRRSAFSPNIKERADCSAALFDAAGQLLVQAEHIPVHLGSMPASVAAAIAALGDHLGPGDQVILNDPFAGGTHLNDVTLVAPAYSGEKLVGWVANRAHHADLGGAAPGSIPADATEIQQEGLRIPPVRLTDEVRALLIASSRTPEERAGDLDAQIGANRLGAERLATFAGQPLGAVLDHGERGMRAALSAMPDGAWSFRDVLDSTGSGEAQRSPAGIAVSVTKEGERITFDFTGTDPQSAGNVNAVEAVTVSAVVFALRTVMDPRIPANAGSLRALRVVAPPGTLVAASFPAAVGAGNVEVSQRVADVCLGALAQALPERVGAASQGTMNNLLIGGDGWVYYETIGGGQGGRPARAASIPAAKNGRSDTNRGATSTADPRRGSPKTGPGLPEIPTAIPDVRGLRTDRVGSGARGQSGLHTNMTNTTRVATDQPGPGTPGQSGIQSGMTNTRNTPVEALERAYPLRVRKMRLRRGSGGAGSAPGGEGIEREIEVLERCTVTLITERRVSQPWGLAGGEPGAVGENWLLPGGDESRIESLPDKCTIQLKAGDVLRMLTPGGGGWGPASRLGTS